MRRLIAFFVVFFGILFVYTGTGHAETPIRLYLDSKQLKPEVPPKIVGGSTLVPVRIISEQLGAKVSWSPADKKVSVEKNGLTIQLQIDKTDVLVNGVPKKLETAPQLMDGSTMLPVRFISENMGLKVEWDNLTRSVSLYNKAVPVTSEPTGEPKPTPLPAGATPTPKPSASPTPTPSTNPSTGSGGVAGGVIPEIQQIGLAGDVLKITATGGKLEPQFIELSNPERLVIDLPYTALSKTINGKPAVQNGEIIFDNPYISKVRYALFKDEPSTVRIVVDLKQKIEYNLLESKTSGELAISFNTSRYVVVLDAGHGMKDTGAVSAAGRYEKDFNLAVVLKAAKLLESEPLIDLRLTRNVDQAFMEPAERADFANAQGAHLFVSVHANSFTNTSVKGTETYYTREDSKELANIMHKHLLTATGFNNRGVKTADYRVTKYTVMPAILLEIGYMSNVEEEKKLFEEALQDRVAASIVAGIKEYLQIP